MLIQHIALVSEDNGPSPAELARVAAALQEQVMRDLAPVWDVSATVHAFPSLEDVPLGVWPIVVTGKQLGGQAGIHLDENSQPYAHIHASASWSLEASRVCLEMLVNPTEELRAMGLSPRNPSELAEFLIEVCGPCDPRRAYLIHGVAVADFCTPAYYGLRFDGGRGYSVNGSVQRPFQLSRYGHLTWRDLSANTWWLRSHWTETPIDTQLGAIDKRLVSVRAFVQACTDGLDVPRELHAESKYEKYQQAAAARAVRLRSLPRQRMITALQRAVSYFQGRHGEAAPTPGPVTARPVSSPVMEPFGFSEYTHSAVDISSEAVMVEDAGTPFQRQGQSPMHGVRAPAYGAVPPRAQRPRRESQSFAAQIPERLREWTGTFYPASRSRLGPAFRSLQSIPPFRSARSSTLLLGGAVAGGLVVLAIGALRDSEVLPRVAAHLQAALQSAAEPVSVAAQAPAPVPNLPVVPVVPQRPMPKVHLKRPARETIFVPAKVPPPPRIVTLDDEVNNLIETRQ